MIHQAWVGLMYWWSFIVSLFLDQRVMNSEIELLLASDVSAFPKGAAYSQCFCRWFCILSVLYNSFHFNSCYFGILFAFARPIVYIFFQNQSFRWIFETLQAFCRRRGSPSCHHQGIPKSHQPGKKWTSFEVNLLKLKPHLTDLFSLLLITNIVLFMMSLSTLANIEGYYSSLDISALEVLYWNWLLLNLLVRLD
jgi:hypothetical protein